MSDRVKQILKTAGDASALPTIPGVALSIITLAGDPEASVFKMAAVLESDPAMAAKTLRFSNSSFYGASKPIATLPQAIVRIGIRSTKLLALSFGLVEACKSRAGGFDYQAFWFRTLTTAVAARRIANRSLKRLADEAFVAALLADIGCPTLALVHPGEYRSVEHLAASTAKRLSDIELQFLGVQHAEISAALLETWQLPETLVRAVAAHHSVDQLADDDEALSLAVLVSAASELADLVIRGSSLDRIDSLAKTFRTRFSFSAEHVELLLKDLEPEIASIGQLLNVPLPPVEVLQAKAKAEALRMAMLAMSQSEPDAAGVAGC